MPVWSVIVCSMVSGSSFRCVPVNNSSWWPRSIISSNGDGAEGRYVPELGLDGRVLGTVEGTGASELGRSSTWSS